MKVTPRELKALQRRDPALGKLLKRVPAFPNFPAEGGQSQFTHYEALARSITYQQVSTSAAATIWKRASRLGNSRGFPKTHEVLAMSMEEMRAPGLSRNKVLAIKDLADHCEDGRLSLRSVARRSDAEVIEELVRVRGIGEWTAQMFLLFKLGRLDIMAPGDMALQEGMRRMDSLKDRPKPRELALRAEVWAPLRSVASWVLWRSLDLD
ncbi:MAG: DNA-3-methyladenine glycosylase II [Candidatus Paceibacteria bacterium]|jgi:DNA-3-methyladenine glycosylase II